MVKVVAKMDLMKYLLISIGNISYNQGVQTLWKTGEIQEKLWSRELLHTRVRKLKLI